MLELSPASTTILVCLAPRDALDALPPVDGATACRVAADELMLVSFSGRLDAELLAARLAPSGGLLVDQSDAYAVWTLSGVADEAFARLSAVELPPRRPAFVQGAVAGVPAKAIAEDDRIHVLVGAPLGHHLRDRVVATCADLLVGPSS